MSYLSMAAAMSPYAQRPITTIEGGLSAVVSRYNPSDPLLTAGEATADRRHGLAAFYRDVAAGRLPPTHYVGPKRFRSRQTACTDRTPVGAEDLGPSNWRTPRPSAGVHMAREMAPLSPDTCRRGL